MTPTHPKTRSLVAILVAPLVAAGFAAPAFTAPAGAGAASPRAAHRVVHRDAAADVLVWHVQDDSTTADPDNTSSDIVRTVVDHAAHRLAVRVELRQLARDHHRLVFTEIRSAARPTYQLTLDYSRTPIGPRITLEQGPGTRVPCPGATWSIDTTTETVSLSVPRSCLGGPAWVRVGVGTVGAPGGLAESWVDDSRRTGSVDADHVRLGPRQPHA